LQAAWSSQLIFRGANAAGLHRHQSGLGAHQQESVLVQPGRNARAGLRAMHLNLRPRTHVEASSTRAGIVSCRRRIEQPERLTLQRF
jgi:hypothetical protein